MPDREIRHGDSYDMPERPLFRISLGVLGGGAFPLAGKIVRTTFKPVLDDDATDAAAVIKAEIRFNDDGTVKSAAGLRLDGPITDGKLVHELTAEESRTIPVGTAYVSDVQVSRFDPVASREVGVYTFLFTDTLTSTRTVTNRTT